MGKAFAYFFVGFLSGLILTELTDGKPAKKIDYNRMYFNTKYIYREFPNKHYYNYRINEDTFNSQRPNTEEHRSSVNTNGNTGRTVETGETHSNVKLPNDKRH
tara:strand:+ start:487 stop:795 length:309 start_codon:yes stop_codon:yes gene_type:complete